jgi:hypothetical protein
MAICSLPLPTSAGALSEESSIIRPKVSSRVGAIGRVADDASLRGPCSNTIPVIATNFSSREDFVDKIGI